MNNKNMLLPLQWMSETSLWLGHCFHLLTLLWEEKTHSAVHKNHPRNASQTTASRLHPPPPPPLCSHSFFFSLKFVCGRGLFIWLACSGFWLREQLWMFGGNLTLPADQQTASCSSLSVCSVLSYFSLTANSSSRVVCVPPPSPPLSPSLSLLPHKSTCSLLLSLSPTPPHPLSCLCVWTPIHCFFFSLLPLCL